VYYVYKDFPIVNNHPQAALAAEAAECAGDQDKYWDMHDQLFAQPEEWDTTPEDARSSFRRYAEVLALNADDLLRCVDEGRYREEVQADFDEAVGLGLNGTPAFIINGKLLVGAQPAEVFVEVLDQELARQ
jgi:protein-disulfide isomerase